MDRFLLAVDLDGRDSGLVHRSAQLSDLTGGEAVLVHALSHSRHDDFGATQVACQDLIRQIEEKGGRVSETLIVRVSEGDALILKSAEELDVGLVVMGWGTDKRLGSIARGVLLSACCSLLLVGPESGASLGLTEGGIERLPIHDFLPLARLSAVTGRLSEVPEDVALLVELDSVALPGVAS
jgi:nucleotide-binding universal stress UspA family protein